MVRNDLSLDRIGIHQCRFRWIGICLSYKNVLYKIFGGQFPSHGQIKGPNPEKCQKIQFTWTFTNRQIDNLTCLVNSLRKITPVGVFWDSFEAVLAFSIFGFWGLKGSLGGAGRGTLSATENPKIFDSPKSLPKCLKSII